MDKDTFESTIKDASVSGIKEYLGFDAECTAVAEVLFSLEPEYRSWGIKGIYCMPVEINAEILWTFYPQNEEEKKLALAKDGREMNDGSVEGSFEITKDGWEVEVEAHITEYGQFSIDDCDIDFANKTITLS